MAQSLAASIPGLPVRRGPMESSSAWPSASTRDESMPICQMRLMAASSVGKVVGRWASAGVPAARPTAVATAARAAVRRRVEDMGGEPVGGH